MKPFQILVVEDDLHTLQQLTLLLQSAIPGSAIWSADNVASAIGYIDAALAKGGTFDLAVLDFHLPADVGHHSQVDESVCCRLMTTMPQIIVGHITAYISDPVILAHLERVHPSSSPRGFQLMKDEGWGAELTRMARQALYGSRIERELAELFSSGSMPSVLGDRTYGPKHSMSVSSRIVDLCLEIAAVWNQLGASSKARIEEFFMVRESDGTVSVVQR